MNQQRPPRNGSSRPPRAWVLADTGPLYAARDSTDGKHLQAQRDLQRLQREHLAVTVPYPIVLECYSLLQRRLGLRSDQAWLDEILAGTSLINPTSDDYVEAARRIRVMADQPLTLFDGLLASLSMRLALPIWTYDHHFDLLRVAVWR